MSSVFFRDTVVALDTANKEGVVSIDVRFVHLYATSFSAIRVVPLKFETVPALGSSLDETQRLRIESAHETPSGTNAIPPAYPPATRL